MSVMLCGPGACLQITGNQVTNGAVSSDLRPRERSLASKRAHSQQGGIGARLSAICEAVGVPQLGYSEGQTLRGLRDKSKKAHLGTLAWGSPSAT